MLKRRYTYAVLRYVHDPITAEFVNVGVVMHAPATSDAPAILLVSTRKTIGRLRQMFPDLDKAAFATTMRTIERQLRRLAEHMSKDGLVPREGNALTFAKRVLPVDDSSLQWSTIGSGVSPTLDIAFDRLCARFITRYDTKQAVRRTDEEIWKPVRSMLLDRALPVELEEKTIFGSDDKIDFQHAWKNGAWHVYEPVSLDLADADNIQRKAYRWLGQLTSLGQASEPFQAYFIVGAPSDPALQGAYQRALKILKKAPEAEVFEESEMSQLVDRIEDDVRHHYRDDGQHTHISH